MHQKLYSELKCLLYTNNESPFPSLEEPKEPQGTGELFSGLGALFLQYVPYFALYSTYVCNYEKGMEQLRLLRAKHKSFNEFVAFEEKVLCEINGEICNLESLMITPVQRLPRYLLLINEIITQVVPDPSQKNILLPFWLKLFIVKRSSHLSLLTL